MAFVFFIVGKNDFPIYQVDLTPKSKAGEEAHHVHEFIVHAALDVVDDTVLTTKDMYLKVVDSFNNEWFVSAFVTASHVRFLVLHRSRSEDNLKAFFQDVYELYIKLVMNPFYELNSKIESPVFDTRVRNLARRYFGL